MAKFIFSSLLLYGIFMAFSFNTTKPEKYLDVAVLNCNVLAGFAHSALSLELEWPPIKWKKENGESTFMSRKELIENKIRISKNMLADLSDMTITADARDILTSSIALHHFVIKVYETDYMLLAKLYDEGASKEMIAALDTTIKNKHATMFELHYENLIRGGKLYATKHKIKIPWAG